MFVSLRLQSRQLTTVAPDFPKYSIMSTMGSTMSSASVTPKRPPLGLDVRLRWKKSACMSMTTSASSLLIGPMRFHGTPEGAGTTSGPSNSRYSSNSGLLVLMKPADMKLAGVDRLLRDWGRRGANVSAVPLAQVISPK